MKKPFLLLLALLPLFVGAQKSVDLDPYKFTVQYRALPAIRIDSTYRTYDISVSSTQLMNGLIHERDLTRTVNMEGWKRLETQGHLTIAVKLGDLLPGDVSVKQRVESVRNSSGVITGNRTFYYQEVIYTFEANAIINDYRGMHIRDEELSGRQYRRVYRSPEFTLRAMAEGYFLLNSLAITKELFRECSTNAMHRLNQRLNEHFGFQSVSVNDKMWVIDSRKHDEYGDWRNAIRQASDVLFSMNASDPITGAREQLKPVIDYFEKIKRNYSSNNRHDRKIRYGVYYNLAVLYYYLDDPASMMREANGLELNDFDAKEARGFKQTATWLKNLFEQNNIYTRHFPVETEGLRGPGEVAGFTY